MRYEEGVLQDFLTELRTAQLILNTKPEITPEDFDLVVDSLNRCEMLVLSIMGSQAATGGLRMVSIGQDFDPSTATKEEVLERLKAAFGSDVHLVMPEDLGLDDEEVFREFNGEPTGEEAKYCADEAPKKKS